MKMNKEQAEKIVSWIKERFDDGEGFSVYENYSGRGMYGAMATAITFDVNLATGVFWIGRAVEALGDDDDAIEEMVSLSSDHLGLGFIVY